MTDLTYIKDGMFTRFMAETEAGEVVWREMADKMGGVAAVLNIEAHKVIAQIRAAGYTVKKAPKCDMDINEIFKELME